MTVLKCTEIEIVMLYSNWHNTERYQLLDFKLDM